MYTEGNLDQNTFIEEWRSNGLEGVFNKFMSGENNAGVSFDAVQEEFDARGISGVFNTFLKTETEERSEPIVQASAAEKKFDILGMLAEKLGFGSTESMISGILDKFFGGSGMGQMISGFFNDASGANNTMIAENTHDNKPEGPVIG